MKGMRTRRWGSTHIESTDLQNERMGALDHPSSSTYHPPMPIPVMLFFGHRYWVNGAQPVEVLRQVADQCLAEGRVG